MVMLGQSNEAVGGCCCLPCFPLGLSSKASGEPPSAASQSRKSDPAAAACLFQVCKKLHMGINCISKKFLEIQPLTSSFQQLKKIALWRCWRAQPWENCRGQAPSLGPLTAPQVGAGNCSHQLPGWWSMQNASVAVMCFLSWRLPSPSPTPGVGRSPWGTQPQAGLRFLAIPHKGPIFIIINYWNQARSWRASHLGALLLLISPIWPPLLCSPPCSPTSNAVQGFPCRCPFHPRNPMDQPLLFILLKNQGGLGLFFAMSFLSYVKCPSIQRMDGCGWA